jgi:hypothetical protein
MARSTIGLRCGHCLAVRAECNYKIGIESEVDEESSEMVQRPISSVSFHDSMKHYRMKYGQHASQ